MSICKNMHIPGNINLSGICSWKAVQDNISVSHEIASYALTKF